jgi:hypothetical protein
MIEFLAKKRLPMPTIKHVEITRTVSLEDLFAELGCSEKDAPNTEDGDTLIKCDYPIEVESSNGYQFISAVRWTKHEPVIKLIVKSEIDEKSVSLGCSPEHRVMTKRGWKYVKNLFEDDYVYTKDEWMRVESLKGLDELERLCDMQVDITHCYYTNGILSHNSHLLVNLGANAIKAGLNVLHYTFELSEHQVSRRYDANICEINADDLSEKKADVFAHYDAGTKYGKLRVKYKPTGTATILTIRAHVEALALRGFVPDLIIIDYADIMRSTRQFDSLRHELKQVYEDLRGYSGELGVPIWTASQSNKEGVNSDFIDETNMSEGYAKAFVADIIVTISRKPVERHSGLGRLYVAKSRAGRDGQLYPIKIDTAQSRFVILGEVQSPSQVATEDDKSLKASIREKWNKVKKDAELALGPNLNETVAQQPAVQQQLGKRNGKYDLHIRTSV